MTAHGYVFFFFFWGGGGGGGGGEFKLVQVPLKETKEAKCNKTFGSKKKFVDH